MQPPSSLSPGPLRANPSRSSAIDAAWSGVVRATRRSASVRAADAHLDLVDGDARDAGVREVHLRRPDELAGLTVEQGPVAEAVLGPVRLGGAAVPFVAGPRVLGGQRDEQQPVGHDARCHPSSPSDHGTAVPRLKISSSGSLPDQTPILSLSG